LGIEEKSGEARAPRIDQTDELFLGDERTDSTFAEEGDAEPVESRRCASH
jgi:hypothetical protein